MTASAIDAEALLVSRDVGLVCSADGCLLGDILAGRLVDEALALKMVWLQIYVRSMAGPQ